MDSSSVTEKGQATIPVAIRHHLGIQKGDKVEFAIAKDGRVLLKKAPSIDISGLTVVEQCLAEEWLSDEDEAAFKDL
jgi:AbrB family looped-hinge helix DNA binding protein